MLGKIVLFILMIGFLVVVGFSIPVLRGRNALRAAQRAYLAAGNSLDPADFAPLVLADDANAARVYEIAFGAIQDLLPEGANHQSTPWLEPQRTKLRPALEAVRTAGKMPQCSWDVDVGASLDNLRSPHIFYIKIIQRLLVADIRDAAFRAQSFDQNLDERIIADLETLFQMAMHLRKDPTLIAQLVASNLITDDTSLYQEIFSDHPAPANNYQAILAGRDHRDDLRRALQFEVITAQATWRDIRGGIATIDGNFQPQPPKFDWDCAYYLRTMRQSITETSKPVYEMELDPWPPPDYAVISRRFTTPAKRTALRLAQSQLRVEMLGTAEELRAYKREHGSYPAVGIIDMPMDPATGELIQYKVVDDGFKLTGYVGIPKADEVEWHWEH